MAAVHWNSAFEGTPAGSADPSQGDDRIRELKETTRTIVAREHQLVPGTDSGLSVQGWHLEGSAKAYYESTAPTNRPDGATALSSADAGRLWIDSDNNKLFGYDGSSWDQLTLGTTIVEALDDLTAAEISQLETIGTTTISADQWGYLGALNQGLTTTSAVTFATVNTGQGANELYDMNQNVTTSSDVTFNSVTADQVLVGGATGSSDIEANSISVGQISDVQLFGMSQKKEVSSDTWTNWFNPLGNRIYLLWVTNNTTRITAMYDSGGLSIISGTPTNVLRDNSGMLQLKDNGEASIHGRAIVIAVL